MVLVPGVPVALAILTSVLLFPARAAVETLGVPCFLGGMSRGLLGRNHPLHIRQNRSAALKKADVVVLAGRLNLLFLPLSGPDITHPHLWHPSFVITHRSSPPSIPSLLKAIEQT